MDSEKENKVTNRDQKGNLNPNGSTIVKNSNSKQGSIPMDAKL